jgi:hypothetical protein
VAAVVPGTTRVRKNQGKHAERRRLTMTRKIGLCVGGIGCAAAVLLAGITMFAQVPSP